MRKSQAGFTLLEMVVAITLVIVLYVTVMDRLLPLRGDAEAAAVATVAGTLRSALGLEVAALLLRGDADAVEELAGTNPVRFLAEIPDNYIGEVSGVNPASLPIGSWYFDSAAGELVYLVRYTEYFSTDLPGPPRLAFRVITVHNERDELAGVRLERVNEYVWTRSQQLNEFLQQQR
jgi:prepilin-type N-terminal cleavage/methylation domain-containing protein